MMSNQDLACNGYVKQTDCACQIEIKLAKSNLIDVNEKIDTRIISA